MVNLVHSRIGVETSLERPVLRVIAVVTLTT